MIHSFFNKPFFFKGLLCKTSSCYYIQWPISSRIPVSLSVAAHFCVLNVPKSLGWKSSALALSVTIYGALKLPYRERGRTKERGGLRGGRGATWSTHKATVAAVECLPGSFVCLTKADPSALIDHARFRLRCWHAGNKRVDKYKLALLCSKRYKFGARK